MHRLNAYLMFPLGNQTVWVVVTGCVTMVVLVTVMVAACIYLKRRRQHSSAHATGMLGKKCNKRGGVGWNMGWIGWECLLVNSKDARSELEIRDSQSQGEDTESFSCRVYMRDVYVR